ncbi:MAG TPA: hypothetical protein DCF68_21245 [Cyanothece sp. UBA12306]|nr:hypothetical protein [Cyanothece sp. UBA12306]
MISLKDAEKMAIDFLMAEWELSEIERDWFCVIKSRPIPDSWWYIVEIAIKDLPDKWVIQVYEDGECDPCYTFTSPFYKSNITTELKELPQGIAVAINEERAGHLY